MDKTQKIGVLLGGVSSERAVSLRSGAALVAAYQRLGWSVVAMDTQPGRALCGALLDNAIDVAVVALHGPLGEDGSVQGLLEVMGIPYTGSSVMASALCMDKVMSKRLFHSAGIATPTWEEIRITVDQVDTYCAMSDQTLPSRPFEAEGAFFVKPACAGSSVGIRRVEKRAEWPEAFSAAAAAMVPSGEVATLLLEQEVVGTEVTLAVLDGEPLPLIEIQPEKGFFDYLSKYTSDQTRYLVPAASLSAQEVQSAVQTGLAAGRLMGCRGVYRVDMIVDRTGRAWVLEINTVPGLTETSLAPKAAAAAGLTFDVLAERILAGATLDSCCASGLA